MRVEDFVASLIPNFERGFGPCETYGITDASGNLVAGIVYHNYYPENGIIEISAAATSPKWLTRRHMQDILEYPFDQLGCRMVVARTGGNNKRALRIWRSIGASEFEIPQLRSPSESEVIHTLTPEQWANSKMNR